MGKPVIELLESAGFSDAQIVQDINMKDRIIKGIKNV
jgi:hypothetical protein